MSSQNAMEFHQLDAELWFVKRLKDHGRKVFTGDSNPTERRERIRQAIVDANLQLAIIGRGPNKKPETYAQCFERFYGESLYQRSLIPPGDLHAHDQ